MIVDIVELPRRLTQFGHEAMISSESVMGYPISNIYRVFGYCDYHDDECFGMGSKHRLINGKDALFRYKFIEPTKYGLAEYFVMTGSPIDIRCPVRSKRIKIFCPWVTITDYKTLKIRKFILWCGINELTRYETEDSVIDSPVEAVIANEVRDFAAENIRDDVAMVVKDYPKDFRNVLISEEKMHGDDAVDALTTIVSNIKAYNELVVDTAPFYWCDAMDIFRGAYLPEKWTDTSVLSQCSFLTHVLHGSVTIGEIRHLFGMSYDMHAYQRTFNLRDMHPHTEISIYSNEHRDLFGVLKYVEQLPYSEFSITVSDGKGKLTLYNPYDPYMSYDATSGNVNIDDTLVDKVVAGLKACFPKMETAEIVRSWAEETYMKIKQSDGKTERYYFDLVSASLGTRSLIRDYSGRFSM